MTPMKYLDENLQVVLWTTLTLMHSPPPEELEALLPANWIKTRPAASQTIDSRVA
jgi:hypothetical protein